MDCPERGKMVCYNCKEEGHLGRGNFFRVKKKIVQNQRYSHVIIVKKKAMLEEVFFFY